MTHESLKNKKNWLRKDLSATLAPFFVATAMSRHVEAPHHSWLSSRWRSLSFQMGFPFSFLQSRAAFATDEWRNFCSSTFVTVLSLCPSVSLRQHFQNMANLSRRIFLSTKGLRQIVSSPSARHYSVKTQLEEPPAGGCPLETFDRKVAEGQLKGDPKQRSVVAALQVVYENILGYVPGEGQNMFSKLFALKPDEGDSPKGLYIHGAVGGGKTMLMDLFYSCCETSEKTRVHFHSFMIDIHKRIHNTKRTVCGDPIPFVADSISQNHWLICFDEFQASLESPQSSFTAFNSFRFPL